MWDRVAQDLGKGKSQTNIFMEVGSLYQVSSLSLSDTHDKT